MISMKRLSNCTTCPQTAENIWSGITTENDLSSPQLLTSCQSLSFIDCPLLVVIPWQVKDTTLPTCRHNATTENIAGLWALVKILTFQLKKKKKKQLVFHEKVKVYQIVLTHRLCFKTLVYSIYLPHAVILTVKQWEIPWLANPPAGFWSDCVWV